MGSLDEMRATHPGENGPKRFAPQNGIKAKLLSKNGENLVLHYVRIMKSIDLLGRIC